MFIVSLFLVLAVAYSLADPLYESTDELRHVRYVRHISAYRSLPVQGTGGPRAQSHHPPLYYALGALVSGWVPVGQDVYYSPPTNPFWGYRAWEVSVDNKNQYLHSDGERFPFTGIALTVYLMRWMTVLIGAGVVWLTHRVGRRIFPDRPALAVGGAALVAFNPQFLYLSGAVNNDIPAALCGAAVLLACIHLVQDGPDLRKDLTLGVLFGLSLITKFHLLALAAPIALAYLLAAWPTRDWRALLRGAAVIVAAALLLSGWWFWRNWRLYGELTGMNMLNQLWKGRSAGGNWWVLRQKWPYLWSSLWGRFGYGQVPMPNAIYRGLQIFCLVALSGYLVSYLVPGRRRLALTELALLVAFVLLYVAVVVYYMLIQPAGAMGRFAFPALSAFALFLIGGLGRFFSQRLSWVAGVIVTVMMAALAVYALLGVLAPAFAPPRQLSGSAIEDIPNPTSVDLGGVARLRGYRVTPRTFEAGDVVKVTLYWETLSRANQNYAVFVHLLSDVGTVVAQRDTYPGLGRYPTTAWEPGVVFADTYRVHIPETAYAPDEGYVQVGLYLPEGPRLLTPDGRSAVRLGAFEVRPRPGEFPNPLEVNFDDKLALVGYKLDRRVAEPGEAIHLTLYWRALNSMAEDYRAFAHLLGAEDQLWATSDTLLVDEAAHTSRWEAGRVVEETRKLVVGEGGPPGIYDIEVGLRARGEGRLPVVAEDGHWLDDRVLLSKVWVTRDE